MKKPVLPTSPALPAPVRVPVPLAEACTPGNLAQAAFRRALLALEGLRTQLHELQAARTTDRQRYWQQVGPAAAGVVAARRALYGPLEAALLSPFFSRLEEERIVQFILGNAGALAARFGEDEAVILARYTPAQTASAAAPKAAEEAPAAHPPAHEQAAQARQRTRAQRLADATALAACADQQRLQTSAKTVYRQLARAHHPDLERDPAQQQAKTALMQEITAAYEAGDLYALLQLMADSAHAEAADADVLVQYTQALHRQQIDLKNQLNELKYGPDGPATSIGKKREIELRQVKRDLRAEAEYIRQVGHQIQEPAGLREMLRELVAEGLDSV